jgi:DNA-binding transcriptional regulator YdaS (Cro superfamily)
MESKNPAIEEAYARSGGRKKVQESLRVTKATLSDWKRQGYVPIPRCPDLERLSGISRRKLNPDFDWGPVREKAHPGAARKPKTEQERI